MSPEALTVWSYALLVILIINGLIVAGICGPTAITEWTPIVRRLIASAKRLLTKAGDGCPNCRAWHQPVHCLVCRRTVMLRPAEVIPTASVAPLGAKVASFEERRRRAALAEFEELDAMWEARN